MGNLIRWGRPSMLSLQRDIEDLLDDFSSPRALRREIERAFEQAEGPTDVWQEMDRLFDEFAPPPTLRRRIARLFEDLTGARAPSRAGVFVPSVDLTEHENEYVLKVDLPGMREQDIDVRIEDNNVLTISGERREEEKKRVRGYEYSERRYGRFSRSVTLPSNVETSKVEADFRNGVLEVHVPKTEAARARKIPIREEQRALSGNGGAQAQQAQAPQGQPRVT